MTARKLLSHLVSALLGDAAMIGPRLADMDFARVRFSHQPARLPWHRSICMSNQGLILIS